MTDGPAPSGAGPSSRPYGVVVESVSVSGFE